MRSFIAISVNLAKSYQTCGSSTSLCTERQRGKILMTGRQCWQTGDDSGSCSESSYCSESSTGESEPERDQPDRIIRSHQVSSNQSVFFTLIGRATMMSCSDWFNLDQFFMAYECRHQQTYRINHNIEWRRLV